MEREHTLEYVGMELTIVEGMVLMTPRMQMRMPQLSRLMGDSRCGEQKMRMRMKMLLVDQEALPAVLSYRRPLLRMIAPLYMEAIEVPTVGLLRLQ